MPNSDAYVAAPHVHKRCSAAVVGSIHSEKIFLLEARLQREHPVRTILVGTALIRPEGGLAGACLRSYGIRMIRPRRNSQRLTSFVRVANLKGGHSWRFVVDRNHDSFLQPSRCAGEGKPASAAL